ncbi:MAG: GAF domain-containing protein [Gaiellaceae bacterium]
MTEQIVGPSVDELLPGQTQEIARLGMLVEAAGRLFGTLDLDAVLPDVLELAQSTLAVDAYALWRRDLDQNTWTLQASAGLSGDYVAAAPAAIRGNESVVELDGPLVVNDVASATWLTPEHKAAHAAEGTVAMIAAPLHHRGEVIGTLVFYSRGRRTFGAEDARAANAVANLAAAAIGTASVYQKQAQLAETRRLLAEASDVLASSLDYETTLANVAALVVPKLADWCVIDIVAEGGAIQRLAVAHQDPEKVEQAQALIERLPVDPDSPRGVPAVIRTQEPELRPVIPDALLEETFRERPALLQELRELGLRSSMTVPLVARRRALGAITFVASESGRTYDEDDLAIALDLARRAAAAVDNAVLYREALLKESQVRFLAEAGSVLSAELDYDATLEALARLAVPRVADWCIVDVIDGAEIRRVAVAAADDVRQQALEELRDRYPPTWDSPQPAARALREGAPVIFEEFVGDRLDDTVVDDDHLRIMAILDPHSAVAMPLVARGEKVGAITFAWSQTRRHYSERDLPLMDDLATRAALAVDNARLYARERATGDQLAFLAEMSSVLAASLDYETTLANVAQLIVPQFADWCAVDIVKEDGTIDRLTVVHRDPAKSEWARRSRDFHPPDPEEPEGSARVVRSGEAVLYRRITDDFLEGTAQGPDNLEVLRQLGMASAMVVPMKARGRTLGALMLVSSDPKRLYDDDALTFAEHLGRRAAIAVDNAVIYGRSEQRAHAARALAFVADGIVLVDEDGIVRIWNAAAEIITGLPERDVVNRLIADVVPGWSVVEEHVPLATGPGAPRAETVPLELERGERWLSISGVSLPGGTVYAFRDLTEERRVERLKSEFVSTISHELRTPLAAIYGAALTLQRQDPALDSQRDRLLDVVAAEAERLARIVNDILWVSRVESGTLHVAVEKCDPTRLALAVVEAAQAHLPDNLALALEADADLPSVAADADKVRQILANLVDNAVKYSPDGGRIRVRITSDDVCVRFAVIDAGLGIPAGEQHRIFEKFYRLDPELTRGVGGTGLGLYISRELVRRMNGRIHVESTEGAGAAFTVELPIAR